MIHKILFLETRFKINRQRSVCCGQSCVEFNQGHLHQRVIEPEINEETLHF